jgi:hypothetical protein
MFLGSCASAGIAAHTAALTDTVNEPSNKTFAKVIDVHAFFAVEGNIKNGSLFALFLLRVDMAKTRFTLPYFFLRDRTLRRSAALCHFHGWDARPRVRLSRPASNYAGLRYFNCSPFRIPSIIEPCEH